MRTCGLVVVALILTSAGSPVWANEPPALAKARTLYNAGDFEGAIDAASMARKDAEWGDAAAPYVSLFSRHAIKSISSWGLGCRFI
jgi:hypothetical protein